MSNLIEETVYYQDRTEPFAHLVFFRLSDTSDAALNKFLDECKTHLSGYRGRTHFSIGLRALQIRGPESAVDYDVAVQMVFENYRAYEKYNTPQRQLDFVAAVAGMISHSIVYDYFLDAQAGTATSKGSKL